MRGESERHAGVAVVIMSTAKCVQRIYIPTPLCIGAADGLDSAALLYLLLQHLSLSGKRQLYFHLY